MENEGVRKVYTIYLEGNLTPIYSQIFRDQICKSASSTVHIQRTKTIFIL